MATNWKQVPIPNALMKFFKYQGGLWKQAFTTRDGRTLIKSQEKTPHGILRHISVARRDRYPTWDEIMEIKQDFFGDTDCMMVMPKKADYISIQNHCFHVWQMPVEWGIR